MPENKVKVALKYQGFWSKFSTWGEKQNKTKDKHSLKYNETVDKMA